MSRWNEERWERVGEGWVRRLLPLEKPDVSDMTKAQLAEELESLGLPKTGSKSELQERLAEARA